LLLEVPGGLLNEGETDRERQIKSGAQKRRQRVPGHIDSIFFHISRGLDAGAGLAPGSQKIPRQPTSAVLPASHGMSAPI